MQNAMTYLLLPSINMRLNLDISPQLAPKAKKVEEAQFAEQKQGSYIFEEEMASTLGGGKSGCSVLAVAIIAASLAVVLPATSAATSHTVGGSKGWTIPPNSTFYSSWSTSQSFSAGDTLVFNFPTGAHNVIEVPKSGFDNCSSSNKVGSTLSTGPASVTLTAGDHYYICGVPGHCSVNQKLSITVAGSPESSSPVQPPVAGDTPEAALGPAPLPTAGGSPDGGSAAPPSARFGMMAAAAAGLFLTAALW